MAGICSKRCRGRADCLIEALHAEDGLPRGIIIHDGESPQGCILPRWAIPPVETFVICQVLTQNKTKDWSSLGDSIHLGGRG